MTTEVKGWELGANSSKTAYERFLDKTLNLGTKAEYKRSLDLFLEYTNIHMHTLTYSTQ